MKSEGQPFPVWRLSSETESRVWISPRPILHRSVLLLAGAALLIVVWLTVILLTNVVNFVLVAPRAQTGFEAFLTIGLLLGALVLLFIPDHSATGVRLRWLATGMFVFAFGASCFGFTYPLIVKAPSHNTLLYGYLITRTIGTALIAIGMAPANPPRPRPGALLLIATGTVAVCLAIFPLASHFPTLITHIDVYTLEAASTSTVPGTTPWHWVLGTIPFVLGVVATIGAIRAFQGQPLGPWVMAGLIALTGAHLHSMFWPPVSITMLTTSGALRLAFTLLILAGGLLDLRQLLLDRTALLAAEQEHTRRLRELAILKDDFTAMVAHELASPLGAISALADLTALADATAEQRTRAFTALHDEIRLLNTLVADVQSAIAVEGQEFACHLRPVPLAALFERAAAFATTLDVPHHPITFDTPDDITVIADEDRIGQVLRNLISNAVKYTPPGTPIHLRAIHDDDQQVRVDVIDWGLGLDPADQVRIFGKYERAVHGHGPVESGRGLGLYLSQNILRMHRSELTLESSPGMGARFSFVLRVTS